MEEIGQDIAFGHGTHRADTHDPAAEAIARAGGHRVVVPVHVPRQALGPRLTRPMPGGHISAFCEPLSRISTLQSSWRISSPPRPLTESTIRMAGLSLTILPIAARSATAPVALSLWTRQTAR